MLRNITGIPNWEMVAFVIINRLLVGKNRRVIRSEIMTSENLSLVEFITGALGHKKKPRNAQETLQKTLQNMRDKGFIDFLGSGEYEITNTGYNMAKEFGEKFSYEKCMSIYRKEKALG
jgi:NAD/NADP transhydrogenase beta subunit